MAGLRSRIPRPAAAPAGALQPIDVNVDRKRKGSSPKGKENPACKRKAVVTTTAPDVPKPKPNKPVRHGPTNAAPGEFCSSCGVRRPPRGGPPAQPATGRDSCRPSLAATPARAPQGGEDAGEWELVAAETGWTFEDALHHKIAFPKRADAKAKVEVLGTHVRRLRAAGWHVLGRANRCAVGRLGGGGGWVGGLRWRRRATRQRARQRPARAGALCHLSCPLT